MNLAPILRYYVFANSLLLGAYLIFYGLSHLIRFMKVAPGYRPLISLGQVLILISILAPVGLQLTPSRHLSSIEWGIFRPIQEYRYSHLRKKGRRHVVEKPVIASENKTNQKSQMRLYTFFSIYGAALWSVVTSATATAAILFGILIGIAFSLAQFLRNVSKLKRAIHFSTPFIS